MVKGGCCPYEAHVSRTLAEFSNFDQRAWLKTWMRCGPDLEGIEKGPQRWQLRVQP